MSLPFIRTTSGTDVPLAAVQPAHISIRDIAHHLALINRFNGATPLPYSVAQHSVLVADLLLEARQPVHVVLAGLLHDAHEAYLGDIPTPVKLRLFGASGALSAYDNAAAHIDAAVHAKCGLTLSIAEQREITLADMKALATEWRDLMPGKCPATLTAPHKHVVKPLPWGRAEDMFISTYNSLALRLGLPTA